MADKFKMKLNSTGTVSMLREKIVNNHAGKFMSIQFSNWSGNDVKVVARMLPTKGSKVLTWNLVRVFDMSTKKNVDVPLERVRVAKINGEEVSI